MAMNQEKCIFGVQKGEVLGCLVDSKGIEVNLEEVKAITSMQPPRTRKEVQLLTGRMAALNRFISKSVERSLPFLKTLKGSGNFEWTDKQQKAFEELREHLSATVRLACPEQGEVLLQYVSANHFAVNAALVQERKIRSIMDKNGKEKALFQQYPIYFVSKALAGSKLFYSQMEKICYAVVMAARKLRHYFEAHNIRVLKNQPLNDIFGNREASSRIGKWAMELSEHVIDFERRSAAKSQVLANFIVDLTAPGYSGEGPVTEKFCIIQCDSAWGSAGVGAAVVITSPLGIILRYAVRLEFCNENNKCTNNIAEYKAVLMRLRKVRALGVKSCKVKIDSRVVASHVDKDYETREPVLAK